jgi:glyoxylase-like metal-dependent hydrolase (beta-lactamase superfamily II)
MTSVTRFRIAVCLLLLATCLAPAALAQGGFGSGVPADLSGEWRKVGGEDVHERGTGPDPGEFWGLPVNDAARMRADTYNAEWASTSLELQCRPHPTGYQQLGPDPVRIEKETDPITRELIAYRILFRETPGERVVWVDGRPLPSEYAARSWEGFSTGKWEGDTFTITSTHMKESFMRRNGVPASFRRTVVEHVSLDEPYLTWVIVVHDPDYLTEPLMRSVTFVRAPNNEVAAYPCASQQEEYKLQEQGKYTVPHYLPGENKYLTEVAVKYKVPLEGVRGGAETLYPAWYSKGKGLPVPAAESTLKPAYNDESTRVAERADAQPRRAPSYEKVETLHVNGNVFMLAGAGGNISLSVGGDGVVMVDAGAAQAADKVLAAIPQIVPPPRPPVMRDSASPYANTWQITHSAGAPAVRMIINTSIDSDHTGGNEKIRESKIFHPIGVQGDEEASEVILAHENVQRRMIEANASPDGQPTHTYYSGKYRLHRYFNGEGVEIIHMPNAHTDGDSIVWFRGSNVIATGDVFNTDTYPVIDVEKGGSIQGVIDALILIADMCYPEFMGQGGTMVIPGHGWLSDAADVSYYRDMVIILRDRIQSMIDKRMTLQQVKAAKPTMDYDPLFGRNPGSAAQFVEAVYRSLTERKAQ